MLAHSTPDGMGNLRFAVLANVAPRGPLIPGAYHDSGNPSFGLAVDAAELVTEVIAQARSLEQVQTQLIRALNDQATKIRDHVETLVDDHSLHFAGIDFSLGPSLDGQQSLVAGLERLGMEHFGGHGTVFAVAFLQNCIRQSSFQATGSCGIILPPLGDQRLGQRAMEQCYTVNDLLLYVAAGSSGLEVIPLPGDTTAEQLAGILLDAVTLAVTLDRPLAARLLPWPGKQAGDTVTAQTTPAFQTGVLPVKSTMTPSFFKQGFFLDINGQ
jgi:uncharacterized protein (UPF0210 family)